MCDSDRLRLAPRPPCIATETTTSKFGNDRFPWLWSNGGGCSRLSCDNCRRMGFWTGFRHLQFKKRNQLGGVSRCGDRYSMFHTFNEIKFTFHQISTASSSRMLITALKPQHSRKVRKSRSRHPSITFGAHHLTNNFNT